MVDDLFKPQISTYVISVRDWKLACAIKGYLSACDRFSTLFGHFIKDVEASVEELRSVNKTLAAVHKDLLTVFRHLEDPSKKEFENAAKFTPEETEIHLMANVDLLLHKVVVVEEYKCGLYYYPEGSDEYASIEESLSRNLVSIKGLFNEGRDTIRTLLGPYKDNIFLLVWMIENRDDVTMAFGESVESLLSEMFGEEHVYEAYLKVGEYYLESGWGDLAKAALAKGAQLKEEAGRRSSERELALNGKEQK